MENKLFIFINCMNFDKLFYGFLFWFFYLYKVIIGFSWLLEFFLILKSYRLISVYYIFREFINTLC